MPILYNFDIYILGEDMTTILNNANTNNRINYVT